MSRIARHANRLFVLGAFIAAVMAVGMAQPVAAATATITSAGPLTTIGISTDLNCSVNHTGDSSGEFYGGTACGTLVSLAGILYGPAAIPAGESATDVTGYTPFTPVSQSAVSGAGTSASPFSVTTVVNLGGTGFSLTETDTYVVGQEAYLTNVSIHNATGSAQSVIIYRAGDCFLQDSDRGLGQIDGAAVACKASADSVSPNRIEQWYPITPGSSYMEDNFDNVWAQIGSQAPFANTCQCDSNIDNGAGLSWSLAIAAGASTAVQQYTTFSPLGIQPITVTKTADSATATPGATDGYTISVANPGSGDITLTSLTDTLPAGFSYTASSTTGGVTTNPAVSGQTLTWNGPITVTAGTTLHVHFSVKVSSTPGTYTNSATATGDGLIIVGATNVAPVTVAGAVATTAAAPAAPVAATPAFTG